jgi:hypothetical protein
MKLLSFTRLIGASAALALLTGVASTELSANTITMADYTGGGTDTVSCDTNCLGFEGGTTLSTTGADRYAQIGASNDVAELAQLNGLLALLTVPRGPETYVNATDGAGTGFTTSRQYFSIKQASAFYFFENTSGGSVTVDLGTTPAYSHWTEYGSTVSAVPVPAAVWLFGSALIGLVGFGKRRKAA